MALNTLIDSTLATTYWGDYCCSHFTDGKMGSQNAVSGPSSDSRELIKSQLSSADMDPPCAAVLLGGLWASLLLQSRQQAERSRLQPRQDRRWGLRSLVWGAGQTSRAAQPLGRGPLDRCNYRYVTQSSPSSKQLALLVIEGLGALITVKGHCREISCARSPATCRRRSLWP